MLARLLILNHTPQDGCSLQQYLPTLWASARRIYAQLVVWVNMREQVFHRNKIDARGSIRKAPNVISWTISLDKLRHAGDKDAGAIIRAWNNEASGQQQLVGGKAQALKNVLGLMPVDVFTNVLLPAVSELSWEKCPWPDDSFSNKRIFPGGAPRAGDAAWRTRLRVSEQSMGIMFLCQVDKHKKLMLTCSPQKLAKAKMDEYAEQAALVSSLLDEVKALVPIPDDILQETFVRAYIENDPQVHLEICSVLATRAGDFSPQDLAVLKALMDTHCGPRNVPIIDAMAKLEDHKASLDEQEFQLLMNQLSYDVDAWRVHKHTCYHYTAAVFKQKHTWNLKRHEQAGKAADAFLKQHCLILTYSKDPTKAVMEFLQWRKSIVTNLQIPEERGYTFALCNLSAPSMSQGNDLAFYGSCASCLVKGQNLMAVVMLQFAYKKGQLYIVSRSIEDIFINRGLNMDSKWAIVFKQKSDNRDSRPLVYDGRLIVPTDVKEHEFVFKNTPLMHGRTDMAEMLPGGRMKAIEDVSAGAVPVTTDLDGTVKGAQKHAQLGQDAMEKILDAATQDICMPDRGFMMFFETNMLFGDMFDAFLEKRPQWNFPTYFVTACGSESHCDWWMHTKRDILKSKHLAGKLQIAGYSVLPEAVPQDVMETAPSAPQLGKMVVTGKGGEQHLCAPDALTKKWYHHPVFGSRYRAFLDGFHEESSRASLSGLSGVIVLVM